MKVLHRCIGAILITVAARQAGAQAPTVIVAGALLDPATGAVVRNQVIITAGGRITAVGTNPVRPPDARIIDLSRYTVMPGMIDGHVHLAIGGSVRDNALADLKAGFTTVVDLGSRTNRLLRLRDSINSGLMEGPRVLAAGVWVGTKDGVCEFNGIGIAGGPDAFAQRVRENVAAGADLIKVCVSGWPQDAFANADRFEISSPALAATITAAHDAGKLVVGHDISRAGVRAALDAGIDGLAHAAYLDAPLAADLARKGVFMVPTLASLTAGDTSAVGRGLIAGTAAAMRAGVPIVFGTDGGVLPHGQNAAEFASLAAAGLDAVSAIRAATVNAAKAYRIADSVGSIKPGMSADIIAVDGNPLADVAVLGRVRFVMSRGRIAVTPAAPDGGRPPH